MGCFDMVFFPCPKCGPDVKLEAQSKGGECAMKTYSRRTVPLAVAGGMVGDKLSCSKCGGTYEVVGPTTVQLELDVVQPDEEA
jgi:hypothetical protein